MRGRWKPLVRDTIQKDLGPYIGKSQVLEAPQGMTVQNSRESKISFRKL